MRQMGLSALYPKPRTSQPGAGHKVYPYLADRRNAAHREGDLERAAALSREPNVYLGPERYREIRGVASAGGAVGAGDRRGRGAAEGDL